MEISKEVTISIEEYKKILTQNSKYQQLKKFLVNSISNNKVINALCVIEGKNLWEIIDEIREEK